MSDRGGHGATSPDEARPAGAGRTPGARVGHGAPLRAEQLPALLARVHDALASQRDRIDRLNVFPVPDGDTGTNMTLTVAAALEALRGSEHADADAAARAVTRGAIRGARGNSGVILSQVLRAVVDVVTAHREVDAEVYADALGRARDLAYEAVAHPVEGTILTVIAAAAAEAETAVADGDDLVAASARVTTATHDAVDATRDQLDVLRDAGVVDAGGRGFEVLVAAVHAHLTGDPEDAAHDHPDVGAAPAPRDEGCHGSLAYAYEVQYLLESDDAAAAATLRRRLERLGDSVVVVEAGGLLNVHVHTDDVGGAIEEGVAFGAPSDVEVTRFADQVAPAPREAPAATPATVAAVAVVSGSGAVELARAVGAIPVEGGAGRLPSVADLLHACEGVQASTVVFLPGHPNAVPAARQASDLAAAEAGREVAVVAEAATLPAVLAALAVLDRHADPVTVVADLAAAAGAVRCGEVVDAVRDADTPVGPVRSGQPLAVVDGRVVGAASDHLTALSEVCDRLELAGAELVSLLIGADAPTGERARAAELVRSRVDDDAEVTVIDTGHRPARYLVGVE